MSNLDTICQSLPDILRDMCAARWQQLEAVVSESQTVLPDQPSFSQAVSLLLAINDEASNWVMAYPAWLEKIFCHDIDHPYNSVAYQENFAAQFPVIQDKISLGEKWHLMYGYHRVRLIWRLILGGCSVEEYVTELKSLDDCTKDYPSCEVVQHVLPDFLQALGKKLSSFCQEPALDKLHHLHLQYWQQKMQPSQYELVIDAYRWLQSAKHLFLLAYPAKEHFSSALLEARWSWLMQFDSMAKIQTECENYLHQLEAL